MNILQQGWIDTSSWVWVLEFMEGSVWVFSSVLFQIRTKYLMTRVHFSDHTTQAESRQLVFLGASSLPQHLLEPQNFSGHFLKLHLYALVLLPINTLAYTCVATYCHTCIHLCCYQLPHLHTLVYYCHLFKLVQTCSNLLPLDTNILRLAMYLGYQITFDACLNQY